MNVDNIRRLAAHLRTPEVAARFDMNDYIDKPDDVDAGTPIGVLAHNCGTVACIAGWAAIMAEPDAPWLAIDERSVAAEFLGITDEQSWELFTPSPSTGAYSADAERAAEVLEHLAETGEVVW